MVGTYQQFSKGSRARDKAGGKGEKEKRRRANQNLFAFSPFDLLTPKRRPISGPPCILMIPLDFSFFILILITLSLTRKTHASSH
jgi:hypothetical protein